MLIVTHFGTNVNKTLYINCILITPTTLCILEDYEKFLIIKRNVQKTG